MNDHSAIRGNGYARPEESNEVRHQLWLIYCDLKDAESDPVRRVELVRLSRELLGKIVNDMNRMA